MSERKEEDVYVYLLCNHFLCRINVSDSTSSLSDLTTTPPTPQIEIVVDFLKEKLPLGMSPFVLDHSKLYMLGGVELMPSNTFNSFKDATSHSFDNLNKDVFVLNSANNCFVEANDSDIPKMNCGKTSPIVAHIDGKVYVLASKDSYFDCYEKPKHKFEVFDPSAPSWNILPDPPFCDDERESRGFVFSNYFILRKRLFIQTAKGPFFFDVDSRQWGSAGDFMHQFPVFGPFPSPMMCSIAQYDDLTVAYTNDQLVAYQFSTNCELKSHRVLDELKELCEPRWELQRGFVFHLGGGKMCFVLSGYCVDRCCFLVRVSIFLLSSLMLTALLSKHDYNVDYLLDGYYLWVRYAFALFGRSNKRSPEYPTLDSSFKEAKCT